MRKSHELLLKFRYDRRFVFSDVEIWYADRGAPSDLSCISGNHILSLEAWHMEIESPHGTKHIPYHRIRKILYAGSIAWTR